MNLSRIAPRIACCTVLLLAAPPVSAAADDRAAIDSVLTDFHDAAANADFDRYFGHFADDGVFYGTAPEERWTVSEFKRYAKPRFDTGDGWSYTMHERHIFVAHGGDTAWFDEIVESAHYGNCRGTGALVKTDGRWRISQYNLIIPVPNDFADQVMRATKEGLRPPKTIVVVRHMEKQSGDDPGLTGDGRARAERLQAMLRHYDFGAVFSTDTRRTRETAEDFARAAGVEIELYGPHEYYDVVSRAREVSSGDAALIVGHSNTIPALLRAFGIDEVTEIENDEYGNLFLVHLDELGQASLAHLHF
jgi:ketosteroid isomerase-like protein/phosphohistidine phosphatase SixA